MQKILGTLSVIGLAAPLLFGQSAPASADVVVNNVLSPFTTIEVGPRRRGYGPWGYGYGYGYGPSWGEPYNNARCYTHWDPWYGERRVRCVRRYYGGYYPY
jgi:hypothetical protein